MLTSYIVTFMTCCFAALLRCGAHAQTTTVNTTHGLLEGKLVEDWEDVAYYAYLGIPYAEPPTGDRRFLPPVAKAPWEGTLNATQDGPVCPQKESSTYTKAEMDEDCLYINVYVPKEREGLLPVVVYIHGGEFSANSGRTDNTNGPQLFLKENVTFVTINYRLAALGFLSVGTDEAPGNAGIKDSLLALQWIKDNIASFGGDPDNITVGGNSAGAVLVHYLLLTEKSLGLFQRAYLTTGSALGYRFLARHPTDVAFLLGKELGSSTSDNVTLLLEDLRSADAFDIVAAQSSIGSADLRGAMRPFQPFVPCIENASSDAVLTEDPLDIINNGIPVNVPLLLGFNAQEGMKMLPTVVKNTTLLDIIDENFELSIPSNIEYPLGSNRSLELASSIKNLYFGQENLSNETLSNFVQLISDTQFVYAIDSWVRAHKNSCDSSDLYYYLFDYVGDLNLFKLNNNIDFNGTAHGDEIGYLFVTNATRNVYASASEESKETSEIMVKLFTNFVKYGDPTVNETSFEWEKVTNSSERKQLIIDNEPRMSSINLTEYQIDFWDSVYDEYYSYVTEGGEIEAKIIP